MDEESDIGKLNMVEEYGEGSVKEILSVFSFKRGKGWKAVSLNPDVCVWGKHYRTTIYRVRIKERDQSQNTNNLCVQIVQTHVSLCGYCVIFLSL